MTNEYKVTGADVMKLKNETGCGILDCKKVLLATNGDKEKAIAWLKENIRISSLLGSSKKLGRCELVEKYVKILHDIGFKEVNVSIIYDPGKHPRCDIVNTSLLLTNRYTLYTDGIIGKGIYDIYNKNDESNLRPKNILGSTVLVREAYWLIIYDNQDNTASIRVNIVKDDEMGVIPLVTNLLNESILRKEPELKTCVKITTLNNGIKKAEFVKYEKYR